MKKRVLLFVFLLLSTCFAVIVLPNKYCFMPKNLISMSINPMSENYVYSNGARGSGEQKNKSIYVVDEYNGEQVDFNGTDSDYYVIVSNKKVSDEQAVQMVNDMERTKNRMDEYFDFMTNQMEQMRQMMEDIFSYEN